MLLLKRSTTTIDDLNMAPITPCKFDDWSEFLGKCSRIDWEKISHKNIQQKAKSVGLKCSNYNTIREILILQWKSSCSRSLFNFLLCRNLSTNPSGQNVFDTMVEQTKFLTVLVETFQISKFDTKTEVLDGKPVLIKGDPALTLRGETAAGKFNQILQMICLYQMVCEKIWEQGIANKTIKPPKYLYRGVHPLWFSSQLAKSTAFKGFTPQEGHYTWKKTQWIDCAINHIMEHGPSCLADQSWVSTTKSRSIARYFTGKESFVLRIPFSAVKKIFSSEKQDPILNDVDVVSNRREQEYIIEFDPTWKPTIDDFEIYDSDYFGYHGSPLIVNCLDTKFRYVEYEMNGKTIRSRFFWQTETKGSVSFQIRDEENGCHWPLDPREFKQKYGFDPKPTSKNLSKIGSCKIFQCKSTFGEEVDLIAQTKPEERMGRWFER